MTNFTNEKPTKQSKNKAGNPPKILKILMPSIPEVLNITQVISAIITPQNILIKSGASSFSIEYPRVLMAVMLESAAVT